MKKLLPFLLYLFSFFGFTAKASHIVGGEMVITHTTGNNYQIQIKVYRDCLPGNSNFEDPINVQVYNSSNTLLQTISIASPVITNISTAANNACLSSPPNLCLQEAIYTTVASFPPLAGGYIVDYQRCCRNSSCMNLTNPGNTGATFTQTIPDPGLATNNSSPVFNTLPPIVICANSQLTYTNTATDPDGDSLAYSLYRPFSCPMGGGGAPPFPVVNYSGTFTYTNPITGAPPLAINATTGVLTLFPTQIGQFVIGVCVKEYRNHVLVGTHYRDFQFNVVQCIQNIVSAFTPTSGVTGLNGCVNTSIHFTNSSTGTTNFTWRFGDGYSSSGTNPNHTYTAPGIYTVTLIAEPGQPCADSSTTTIHIYAVPVTTATSNTPLCAGSTLTLLTPALAGGSYSWTGPNSYTSTQQNPLILNAQVINGGVYYLTATVNGCPSLPVPDTVVIYPIPAAPILGSNSPVCVGQSIHLTATTALTNVSYHWSGPNGYSSLAHNPNIGNPQLVNGGTYSCYIVVNGCQSATATINVIVNPLPAMPTASSNSPLCVGQTLQLNSTNYAGTYSWGGPNGFTSAMQNPTKLNIQLTDSGLYTLFVTAATGCSSAIDSIHVVVFTIPVVMASSNSPVCAGQAINLSATTLAGGTYSWSGPNSFTSLIQNPTIPAAPIIDSGIYTVILSLNGCASLPSTTHVTMYPVPAAPVISSNSPVCTGQPINLFAQNVTGGTFSWSVSSSGWTSALQNPVRNNATMAMSGIYSSKVTVNGCSSAQATTNVTVNQTPAPTITVASPVCSGQSLSFSTAAIAGATYSWIGPGGWSSTLQNPVILNASVANSGVYSLVVTMNGCSNVAVTQNVTVNATPAPSITVASPVCSGQTISFLTAAIAGATYSWTGPGGWTSSLQNPTIANSTVANTGTYSLVITSSANCSNAAVTANVTINQSPTPSITSNSPICSGQTINFSTATLAGATYAWSGPLGWTSTAQNPSITNAPTTATGTYSLVVTQNGCSNVAVTAVVNVNQMPAVPVITANTPLCSGNTLTLSIPATAGATYSWTGPGGWTSVAQNPSRPNAQTTMSGTYSVNVTALGCGSANGSLAVTVNQTPSPSITVVSPVCSGQTISFSTANLAGATFAWSGPGGWTSTVQNPTIANSAVANSGVYSLVVTQNNCSNVAVTANVTVNQTPAAPTISSNSPLCAGSSINLTSNGFAGSTYNWSGPNGFTSSIQNPSIANAQAINAVTYNLSITNTGCTGSASSTNVTVSQTPTTPVVGSNSPLCEGSSINLTAGSSAGSSYSWTGPNAYSSAIQNPTINNALANMSGSYTVTASIGLCSSPSASVNVVVNTIPTSVFTVTSPVCAMQNATVTYSGTGTGAAAYNWNFNGGNIISGTNAGPYSVQWTTGGNFSVILSVTENGCTSIPDTQAIQVFAVPTSLFSVQSPICLYDSSLITFTGTTQGAASYNWTFDANTTVLSGSNAGPYYLSFSNPGSHFISLATTENGCVSSTTTNTVMVTGTPSASFVLTPSIICPGKTTIDSATVGTNSVNAVYAWTYTGGSFVSGGANVLHLTFTNPGVYPVTLTVTDSGCVSPTITHNLTVDSLPIAKFTTIDTLGCSLYTVHFTDQSYHADAYSWNFGDGNTSTNSNPVHIYNTGVYSVWQTVTSSAGCKDSVYAPNLITVLVPPVAAFSVSPNPDLYYELPNVVFQFTNHSQFATNYVWNFGEMSGDTSMQLSPIHTFVDSGYFMVQLVAFNAIGCTDTATAGPLMVIPKNNNFIPNAFTPNNDGINDVFYVYGQSLKSASLAIYDRWGELVFESADGLHTGWDGTFHGKPMNTGVYVYSTVIYTLTNKRYVIKGDVTLIR